MAFDPLLFGRHFRYPNLPGDSVNQILNDGQKVEMAFTFAAFAYIIALVLTAFLIFFAIYTIIAIDELKTDYKNPIDQCNSLNNLVLPEYVIHAIFNVLFLLSMQWGSLAWNVPLLAYHVHRYANRPVMSKPGIYDATTIMNADELSRCMREGWIKLGFYLVSFFYYLYRLVSLVPILGPIP